MPEESTTPDLVELARRAYDSGNGHDFDAMMSFYAHDGVCDVSPMGLGIFEGIAAIRGFYEDWIDAYEEFEIEPEEILDLGNGVVVVVIRQNARPVGSTGHVGVRYTAVAVWVEGMIVRNTNYPDIDEAHAAAERLAQERADGLGPTRGLGGGVGGAHHRADHQPRRHRRGPCCRQTPCRGKGVGDVEAARDRRGDRRRDRGGDRDRHRQQL